MILMYGNGTDLTNRKAIQRRAKSKAICQKTMLRLIDVAKEKGAKERVKAYWNTYYCQNRVYTSNSRLFTYYCKNRFCAVCLGIRKAELINKYLPVVKNWEAPYFVTLTVKAVKAAKLKSRIDAVVKAFNLIKNKYRKRSQREMGSKLIGLKTIECCFNPKFRTYNPHLHIIVPNKRAAETLVNDWLKLWTGRFTDRNAQHYRKVESLEKDLIEVIKYETKIFTELDGKKSRGNTGTAIVYIRALDNINAALKGCRLIDRFGFNLPKGSKRAKTDLQMITDYYEWSYHPDSFDWVNADCESTLVNYAPCPTLLTILENNVDIELE